MEMINLRLAVYDKVPEDREVVSRVVSEFYESNNMSAEIHRFFDTDGLVDAFRHNSYEAIFMYMNSMDEVDAAWVIRKLAPDCTLVIISDNGDYSMEGYRLEAFDYWLKPLDEEKINKTLERNHKEKTQGDGSSVL